MPSPKAPAPPVPKATLMPPRAKREAARTRTAPTGLGIWPEPRRASLWLLGQTAR